MDITEKTWTRRLQTLQHIGQCLCGEIKIALLIASLGVLAKVGGWCQVIMIFLQLKVELAKDMLVLLDSKETLPILH
jgi:hypothetical protein